MDVVLGHLQKPGEKNVCKVCGKEAARGETLHYITGFGNVCRTCGLQRIVCDSCGMTVQRITVTVLRGRTLCLTCYRSEREKGEKRILKERLAGSIQDALNMSLTDMPENFRLVGLRLKPGSTTVWVAEYEREDIYLSRCS